MQTIDVRKLDRSDREMVVRQALATSDQDNYKLLSAIKKRLNRYLFDSMFLCLSFLFFSLYLFYVHLFS